MHCADEGWLLVGSVRGARGVRVRIGLAGASAGLQGIALLWNMRCVGVVHGALGLGCI